MSGIINVIQKKGINRGLNLDLNSSVGTKRYQYGFIGNYNLSIINFRLNASNSKRNMDSKQWVFQNYNNGNTRDFYAPHDFNGKTHRISSGIDFFLNKNNELSFQIDYTNDFHSFYNQTFYTNVTGVNDFIYNRNSSHEHKTTDYNVNYRRKFTKEGEFLELDYNLTKNKNILPAEDFNEGTFLFKENQTNTNNLHAFAIDYVKVIMKDKEILILDSLKNWEEKLKYFNFIRIHRSYVISIDKVNKVSGNHVFIDNNVIPIGKKFKNSFLEKIKM